MKKRTLAVCAMFVWACLGVLPAAAQNFAVTPVGSVEIRTPQGWMQELWKAVATQDEVRAEVAQDEVQKILANSFNINARNAGNQTVLMLAAQNGNPQIVQALIDHGANIGAKDSEDTTPLMFAAFNGQTEAARVLLDNWASPNAQDVHGWTALMYAAQEGHTEVARLLVKRHADVHSPFNTIDLALENGHPETANAIKEAYEELRNSSRKRGVVIPPRTLPTIRVDSSAQ